MELLFQPGHEQVGVSYTPSQIPSHVPVGTDAKGEGGHGVHGVSEGTAEQQAQPWLIPWVGGDKICWLHISATYLFSCP